MGKADQLQHGVGGVKIAVLITSRNRPIRLGIALRRIVDTADDPSRVHIAVWLDDDDDSGSVDVVNRFTGCPVTLIVGPRPRALGDAHNALARAVVADLYTVLGDDVYPATKGWDTIMEGGHRLAGEHVYAWKYRNNDPAYPILTREWFQAANGIFTAELFPFWFDDFWLAEVYELVKGEPIMCFNEMKLTGDKGSGTPRMRELKWWYGVFHATRPIRVKEADHIHQMIFGKPLPDRSGIVQDLASTDQFRIENSDRWESEYSAAKGDPDEAYMAARKIAAEVVAGLCAVS